MGVNVASFLTTVWELPDSHASRTKRQVTPFQYVVTLSPPNARLGENTSITMDSFLRPGVGLFDILAVQNASEAPKEVQNVKSRCKVTKKI